MPASTASLSLQKVCFILICVDNQFLDNTIICRYFSDFLWYACIVCLCSYLVPLDMSGEIMAKAEGGGGDQRMYFLADDKQLLIHENLERIQ